MLNCEFKYTSATCCLDVTLLNLNLKIIFSEVHFRIS